VATSTCSSPRRKAAIGLPSPSGRAVHAAGPTQGPQARLRKAARTPPPRLRRWLGSLPCPRPRPTMGNIEMRTYRRVIKARARVLALSHLHGVPAPRLGLPPPTSGQIDIGLSTGRDLLRTRSTQSRTRRGRSATPWSPLRRAAARRGRSGRDPVDSHRGSARDGVAVITRVRIAGSPGRARGRPGPSARRRSCQRRWPDLLPERCALLDPKRCCSSITTTPSEWKRMLSVNRACVRPRGRGSRRPAPLGSWPALPRWSCW